MRLPTPDCPWCARRVEDRGDHFACLHCANSPLPEPVAWYRKLAAEFGRNAVQMMLGRLPPYSCTEARWAARAAMRAVPGLRE
jgi:hypothetical protein